MCVYIYTYILYVYVYINIYIYYINVIILYLVHSLSIATIANPIQISIRHPDKKTRITS